MWLFGKNKLIRGNTCAGTAAFAAALALLFTPAFCNGARAQIPTGEALAGLGSAYGQGNDLEKEVTGWEDEVTGPEEDVILPDEINPIQILDDLDDDPEAEPWDDAGSGDLEEEPVNDADVTGQEALEEDKPAIVNDSEDWALILVNRTHPIPEGYEVDLMQLSNGTKVDKKIYPSLQAMFDDARAAGLSLFVRDGYRTQEEQQAIMDNKIQEYEYAGNSHEEAVRLAEEWVALPGTSEHQMGIAVDINADNSGSSDDAVYSWLYDNAWKYGFIKRYPEDKTEITHVINEPWHYRYVGKKAAQEMNASGQCLEEYLGEVE